MKGPRSRYLFVCMFAIFLLLNLNFAILRSVRTTLAVSDLGGGAHLVPTFELLGAMPGAFIMTWLLAKLLHRFSIEKVFFTTLAVFLGFFLLFSTLIYPFLNILKLSSGGWHFLLPAFSMLFYTMSELWKPALAVILFWGLVNQYIPASPAKKLYAPLMLGGSVGTILSGPLISACTSETLWGLESSSAEHWKYSFNAMTGAVVIIGLITAGLYHLLWKEFTRSDFKSDSGEPASKKELEEPKEPKEPMTSGKVLSCLKDPKLRLLSWIVVADYFAYALGEVIFLGLAKMLYSNPSDYCNFMGTLSMWSGALTFLSSLLIAPYFLQRHKWVISAMVTPVCLLITESLFFISIKSQNSTLLGWTHVEWLSTVVFLGAVQYCLCRGMKYSFFDASKELAYVYLPRSVRMNGKLVVDGLSARAGRGASSLLSLTLISLTGGVIASAFASSIIAIGFTISWIFSTFKLGKLIDKPAEAKAEISQSS